MPNSDARDRKTEDRIREVHTAWCKKARRPREQFSGITMMCHSCEVSSFHIKTSLLSLISMNRSGLIVRPTTRTSATCDYRLLCQKRLHKRIWSCVCLASSATTLWFFGETESSDMTQGPFLVMVKNFESDRPRKLRVASVSLAVQSITSASKRPQPRKTDILKVFQEGNEAPIIARLS